MRVVDLTDTDYAGRIATYGYQGQKTGRELRGKYKANVRPPRGLHGSYARRSRKVAQAATIVQPTAPQGMSYTDRLARFGAVGTMED